jgi:hypothetical protein
MNPNEAVGGHEMPKNYLAAKLRQSQHHMILEAVSRGELSQGLPRKCLSVT